MKPEDKKLNRFVKGISYKDKGHSLKTYGISDNGTDTIRSHENKIEIYGDIKLRDRIIKLLNK